MTDIYPDRWFHKLGFGRSPEHRAAIRNAKEQMALLDHPLDRDTGDHATRQYR